MCRIRLVPPLVVLTLSVIALAQDPPRVRFFFDTNGAAEQADRGAGDLSFVNPVVSGSDRLYLYGQFLRGGAGVRGSLKPRDPLLVSREFGVAPTGNG